jgi:hypothetical protein
MAIEAMPLGGGYAIAKARSSPKNQRAVAISFQAEVDNLRI